MFDSSWALLTTHSSNQRGARELHINFTTPTSSAVDLKYLAKVAQPRDSSNLTVPHTLQMFVPSNDMTPNPPDPGSGRIVRTFAVAVTLVLQVFLSSAVADSKEAMRLLKSHCSSCHNDEKKKGGLSMASREALLRGGEEGEAVVVGAPEQSGLIASLAAEADPHMPPKKQLSAEQIATLTQWVKDGVTWDSAAFNEPSPLRPVTLAALPRSYQPILALALSPDGTRLAAGCGNRVLIYDVTGPQPTLVANSSAHPDPVQSLTWSTDGKLLASGAFRRVIVWNTESFAPERQITDGLTDRVTALRFLPDGGQLVIADGQVTESGTLRIAEVCNGSITTSWQAHGDTIFDLAVSNDGKLLATAGGDKLVKIWDLATRKETARLEGHTAQVLTLAFNTDGGQLVTGGADQQLKVWDVKTREKIMTLGRQAAAIDAVAWIPTGPAVLAVTDSGLLLRYTDLKAATGAQSSESGQERKLGEAGNALYCLAATPNGERIFAGSYDGRLFVWNKDGKLTSKLELNQVEAAASAELSQK